MVATLSIAGTAGHEIQAAVEAHGLAKEYGRVPALHALDLSLPRGGALGVVGPAGAGKSTLLAILAGLVHPSWGELRVLGLDPARQAGTLRRRVGFQRQDPRFCFWLTGRETLQLAGRLLGGSGAALDRQVAALLETSGLSGAADQRTGGYGDAERRRLALAQAQLGGPELLLLDEPFTGLDAAARGELAAIAERGRRSRTVVLAAAALEDLPAFVEIAVVLNRGRTTFAGPVQGCSSVGEALYPRQAVDAAASIVPAPISAPSSSSTR